MGSIWMIMLFLFVATQCAVVSRSERGTEQRHSLKAKVPPKPEVLKDRRCKDNRVRPCCKLNWQFYAATLKGATDSSYYMECDANGDFAPETCHIVDGKKKCVKVDKKGKILGSGRGTEQQQSLQLRQSLRPRQSLKAKAPAKPEVLKDRRCKDNRVRPCCKLNW